MFCDLWQQTLSGHTPLGSLPRQLEEALREIGQRSLIKLYNASNFFDLAAVPPADQSSQVSPRLVSALPLPENAVKNAVTKLDAVRS